MMLDAFHDRVGAERLNGPGEAWPDLLPGAHAGLDRRARGGPGRRAGEDRRRLPEPDRPRAQRRARAAAGRSDGDLRRRHREPRQVQPGLGEVRLLDGARGRHQGPGAAGLARPLQHVQGPRAAAGADRHAHRRLDRRGARAGHEEQVHVLRRDPRRERRPRLQQVASRSTSRSCASTATRVSPTGPGRSRCPRTSPRRPTRRRAGAGSRPSDRTDRGGWPRCARGWRTRASTPTSAPGASTCAG